MDGSTDSNDKRGDRAVSSIRALLVGTLMGLLLMAACAKQPGVTAIQPPPPVTGVPGVRTEVVTPPPTPPAEQPVQQEAKASSQESPLQDIFFDFDKSAIRPDAKAALAENASWLQAYATVAITIEGHCDERGTSEYNVALGERRARAARDYLAALGINSTRVHVVSYGKERPFILGYDESAWKWNRRAHFVVVEKE